ncbi:MAG: signal recognition particle-docking protein FtsY [Anaerotignum sp.]|nr:signal recognition particle-docking protein FtsY [Anaerotignum sp.]
MGLFDFFKKKPAEETPVEEQREGVVEIDGVEIETDVETEEISVEELEAESEIEIEFVDEDGEELLTAEDEDEAEAILEELTDMAGEILAEKPLAEDEVIVSLEDGEVFTADNDEDALAFVEELADEVAEELEEELHQEEESATEETSEEVQEEAPAEEEKPAKVGFFAKLKAGLDKTRKNILGGVDGVLGAFTKIDEDLFEELEEALIMADLGVQTTMDIVENLRKRVKREHATDPSVIKDMLIDEITAILEEGAEEAESLPNPSVLLVIGVNGVGKTTTIGKLAHNYKEEGKTVMLAAADTFRAAAIDQLEIWGERNNVPVIKQEENSDPAAVVFDAVHEARKQNADLLICDTAGRLHNKKNLMEELKKIARVIEREYPAAHKEVYLVLDATTGQNALQQAKLFKEVADITGIVLTKLDGTAKGGIVVAIKSELQIPVRYIGVGEGIHDLQKFNAAEFAGALFGKEA